MSSNAIKVNQWIQVSRSTPSKPTLLQDKKKAKMLLGLILEELLELGQSIEDGVSVMEELLIEKIEEIQSGKIVQNSPKLEDSLDALVDLEVVIHNTTTELGLSTVYQNNFKRVMDSNYSKFDKDMDAAKLSMQKYANQGVKTYAEYSDRGVYVIKREDGKILKGAGYKPPVITLNPFTK